MNRLKSLTFEVLSIIWVLFVASCSSSNGNEIQTSVEENNEAMLSLAVGTWMCTKSTDVQGADTYNSLLVGKEITIYSNRTYSSTAETIGYSGSFTINGSKITAKNNNGDTFLINVSFSGDNMYWEGTSSRGISFNYTFEREGEDNGGDDSDKGLDITQDMIAGDFCWQVEDFTIERGKMNSLEKEKYVYFHTDGSCEVFSNMENAYRINNGKIETYYKDKNEPMFIYTLLEVTGDKVKIRMNGTLDDDLLATIILVRSTIPEPQTSYESPLTKDEFLSAYQTCYDECYTFVTNQQALEQIRIGGDPDNSINASSVIVSETWSSAYLCVNMITTLMTRTNEVTGISTTEMNRMLAELRGLRAFVYYNIAMLWGNVPMYKEPLSIEDRVIPSNQSDVFQFAYEEISKAIPELGSSYNKITMSKDAALMLAAEIALTLKNGNAKDLVEKISWSDYMGEITSSSNEEKPVIWAFRSADGKKVALLYTYNHILLYEQEWMGNQAKAAAGWEEASFTDYGYWAALKRLGYAQNVTGCQDYQLLMPFPLNHILVDPNTVQNPGYW